ncbi:DUF2142 domain-containing protein [Aggregatibacter actinomycetemcomitans]|uniref:DUF2142 domain-containing protein n=1 Tax=Aggregatibacter actinomycetemcomitans TaxID=714 RepID=UPI001E6136F3|nr:DUF2142 domain-containing protein [Aggregatibacter actinomycetemcomitans]
MLLNKFYSKLFILFYFILTFIIGVIITPPYQSPDEFYHFQRGYAISNGQIIPSSTEKLDKAMMKMLSIYEGIPYRSENKVTHFLENEAQNVAWEKEYILDESANTNVYFPLIYLPQALGSFLGSTLDLSLYNMYYLAKIFTLLVSIAILYFASVQYRLSIPVLLILSLPMTMFQMGSTNPDSIIFSLSVFIGSLLARGLDSNYNFTHKDFCKLLFSIFLCVTVKFNMLVLLLLPFFISKRREIRHGSMYSIFIIILSILWIVLAMKLTEAQSHFKEGALHNFSYYIFHMDDLFEIFKNTLNFTYLKSLLRMFLGVLGWVDTKFTINEYLFFGSTSLLAYIFLFIHNLYKLKYVIVSVLLVGVVFLFTHFILLITYNEIGTTQIVGVQGRYFIPIMLIIFSSFILKKSEKTSNNKTISKYFIIVPFLFLFISSFITINTLVSRYYMG